MTGAEMVVQALADQGVEHVFGYPGGAVLPIYDDDHPAGAASSTSSSATSRAPAHAAEGYARSTGKVGVALVTSGPGATNMVTPHRRRADGLDPDGRASPARSPPTSSARRLPGVRHRRHHPRLRPSTTGWCRDVNDLSRVLHEAFYVAKAGRPGPVLVDIPKDVQFAQGHLHRPEPTSSTRATGRAPRATRGDPPPRSS